MIDYPFGTFKICSPHTLGSYFDDLSHHVGPRRSVHILGRERNSIDPDVTKIVSKTDIKCDYQCDHQCDQCNHQCDPDSANVVSKKDNVIINVTLMLQI